MASSESFIGWGSGTWSRGGYGSPVIEVSVDGVSAAGSIGTTSTDVAYRVDVTGVSATGFLGAPSVSGNASALITGLSGTFELGDFLVNADARVEITLGVSGFGTSGTTLVWGEVDTDQTPNWDIIEAA
tara:strand:- start:11622 stop:12008 length:387 start_codon:yes stop_codon:yes gene_type:complete